MKFSIIIVSYNNFETTTKPCLESIFSDSTKLDYEVIIVDNHSTDKTLNYLNKIKNTKTNLKIIFNNINRGFSGGNNDGIKNASGDIIILLNSDTLINPGWLESIKKYFENDKRVGLVGPISNSVGNEQMINIPDINEKNYLTKIKPYLNSRQDRYFYTNRLGFFCIAIKKSVFNNIGLLDENFGKGMFEDDDFCIRSLKAHYKLIVAEDCFVYHKGSVSFSKIDQAEYNELYQKNKKYLEKKHNILLTNTDLIFPYANLFKQELLSANPSIESLKLRMTGFENLLTFTKSQELKSPENVQMTETKEYKNIPTALQQILKQKKYKDIIIYPPTIDWNLPLLQRPQHIALNFSKNDFLFFYGTNNIYDQIEGYKEISPNLILNNHFDELIENLKTGWILFHAAHPNYTLNDLIYWKQKGFKIIYEYMDEIDGQLIKDKILLEKITNRHNQINDNIIDLAVVTSKKLYKDLENKISKNKILLSPNGVEFNRFNIDKNTSIIPEDLKPIVEQSKPIIGYYGALAEWIDYDLLNYLAEKHKNYNFVLLGWNFDKSLDKFLKKRKNVFYLGIKNYSELPQYSIQFDIAIIPFKEGRIAKATSPLKLFEYMSSGKPVVCTKDLVECKGYEGVFHAKNKENFSVLLSKLLLPENKNKYYDSLVKQAKQNTWEIRVKDIIKKMSLFKKDTNTEITNLIYNNNQTTLLENSHSLQNEHEYLIERLYTRKLEYQKLTSSKAFRLWQKYVTLKKIIKNIIKKKQNIHPIIYNRNLKNKDVIIYSVIGWGSRHQRPQQIANLLSKNGYNIFYIENGFIQNESEDYGYLIKKQSDNLFLVTISAPKNLSIYNEIPSEAEINHINKSLSKLCNDYDIKNDHLNLLHHPFWFYILKDNGSENIFYDCMDDHSGFHNTTKQIATIENELLLRCKKTFVTSQYLFDKCSKIIKSKDKLLIIRNAGDFEYFKKSTDKNIKIPKDIEKIKKPIIGYYGAIAEWFDETLIENVAKKFSDASIVLIGNVTNKALVEISKKQKNIHLLGEKPYTELVGYLAKFDVCLIPFKLTNLIKATNPVKVYEYLASGKPIVSTDIPELQIYKNIMYISKTKKEFLENISVSLKENNKILRANRINEAKTNTWDIRIKDYIKYLR